MKDDSSYFDDDFLDDDNDFHSEEEEFHNDEDHFEDDEFEPEEDPLSTYKAKGVLRFLLGGAVAANLLFAIGTILVWTKVGDQIPIPKFIFWALGIRSILNIGAALMVWSWKRIGVIGYFATALASMGLLFYLGLPLNFSWVALIPPAIILAFTLPVWKHMD